jgi:hypothetical protein
MALSHRGVSLEVFDGYIEQEKKKVNDNYGKFSRNPIPRFLFHDSLNFKA